MNSYFAYTRVSTVKQGERGSSLREQKSAIEAYAARHGLSITGWFEEMETAAKLGRRMFNRMLGELQKGQASGVVIHKIDRSARNLKDWAQLGELIDRGVEVHFAHESLDLNSRGGRLSADIQAVVAADFIRNLREEVKKGFYGRLKQGFYPLRAPMGYLDRGKAKAKAIDPYKGPLVRQMFELYASGRYGLDLLRQEMHQRGLTAPSGRPLSLNGVATVLHNPFYVGIIRIHRTGQTFAGIHEPLVSKSVFDQVQQVLSGKAFPHVLKHGFAFRRLLKCAACGYSLIGERQKGHVYYRCHTVTCRGTSLRESTIEAQMRCLFNLLALAEEDMRELRDFGDVERSKHLETAAQRQGQLERARGLCEDRLQRLTDAFLDGDVDKETYEQRKGALLHERASLRDALVQPQEDGPAELLLKKLERGKAAQQQFNSPFADEKREAVQCVTSNLIVEGKQLAFALHSPFDEVANSRISSNCEPCWGTPRTGDVFSHSSDACPLEAGAPRESDIVELVRRRSSYER